MIGTRWCECIKRILREWLLEDQEEKEPSKYLDCLLPTKTGRVLTKYVIVGSMGIRLQGIPLEGQGVRLIGKEDTLDKEQFEKLLKLYQGDAVLTWEDTGKPVK